MGWSSYFETLRELIVGLRDLSRKKIAVGRKDSWQAPRTGHPAASVHTTHRCQYFVAALCAKPDICYALLTVPCYMRIAGKRGGLVVSSSAELADLERGVAERDTLQCCVEIRVEKFAYLGKLAPLVEKRCAVRSAHRETLLVVLGGEALQLGWRA